MRRVKRRNPKHKAGQDELFALWRHHAIFTDSPWRRCVAESVNALTRDLALGQTAWASSVNAAATRRAGGASTASS